MRTMRYPRVNLWRIGYRLMLTGKPRRVRGVPATVNLPTFQNCSALVLARHPSRLAESPPSTEDRKTPRHHAMQDIMKRPDIVLVGTSHHFAPAFDGLAFLLRNASFARQWSGERWRSHVAITRLAMLLLAEVVPPALNPYRRLRGGPILQEGRRPHSPAPCGGVRVLRRSNYSATMVH